MSNFKTTEKGTQLPLLKLKGKDYLQVAHRLVWFRERYPDGIIKTTILHHQEETVIVKAEIFIPDAKLGHVPVSTAHKMESKGHFADYIEKAETGAVGRALALMGIGTQFEPELDEGDRLADAPVTPTSKAVVVETSGGNVAETPVARPSFRKPATPVVATEASKEAWE